MIRTGTCKTCMLDTEVFEDDSQCITCKRLDSIDSMMKIVAQSIENLSKALKAATNGGKGNEEDGT